MHRGKTAQKAYFWSWSWIYLVVKGITTRTHPRTHTGCTVVTLVTEKQNEKGEGGCPILGHFLCQWWGIVSILEEFIFAYLRNNFKSILRNIFVFSQPLQHSQKHHENSHFKAQVYANHRKHTDALNPTQLVWKQNEIQTKHHCILFHYVNTINKNICCTNQHTKAYQRFAPQVKCLRGGVPDPQNVLKY